MILINSLGPFIMQMIQEDEQLLKEIKALPFDTGQACVILIILQVLYSISSLSLTAISRQGKDAIFMKYIPIDLYKQFLYKNIPQVGLNLFVTIIIMIIAYNIFPNINIIQTIILFTISTIINLLNSFLMLIVDIKRPILNWESEHEITKNNPNKIFQYFFMIAMIIIFMYFAKVLRDINIITAIIV
ncbi:MAG: hypothetical protein HUJ68_09120 [Clostridia bacterium]|nr:hypothetical protein [Clostridia bacterium]